jgi:hypothetical protein
MKTNIAFIILAFFLVTLVSTAPIIDEDQSMCWYETFGDTA